MITCFKGDVNVKGEYLSIMTEYISITRTMLDIIINTDRTTPVIDNNKKVACHLMAVIGTAVEGSKLSNRKDFYEMIEKIAKSEKEEA